MTSDLRAQLSTHSNNKRTKYFDLSEQHRDWKLARETINGKRFYVTPEGNKYPSVTTVLSTMNARAINEWRATVGEQEANRISTQASTRGTQVHAIAEKYLQNDDQYAAGAMPANIVTFNQIKQFLDTHCGKVYANEISLYSDRLRAAGQCDLVADIDGVRSIGDFKTAKRHKREDWITNYFYQCTAYAIMLHEREQVWCPQICIMIATDEDGLQTFIRQTDDFLDSVYDYFNNYHKNIL